jgi:predicted transcriptional regulator
MPRKRGASRKSRTKAKTDKAVESKGRRTTSPEGGLVGALSATGMPKGVARTLATISMAGDWLTSKDIEKETRLRQPEVSIAVRDLMTKGWVEQDALKKGSKGRPVYIYRMSADLKKVFDDIRASEAERIKAIEANLDGIKGTWKLG